MSPFLHEDQVSALNSSIQSASNQDVLRLLDEVIDSLGSHPASTQVDQESLPCIYLEGEQRHGSTDGWLELIRCSSEVETQYIIFGRNDNGNYRDERRCIEMIRKGITGIVCSTEEAPNMDEVREAALAKLQRRQSSANCQEMETFDSIYEKVVEWYERAIRQCLHDKTSASRDRLRSELQSIESALPLVREALLAQSGQHLDDLPSAPIAYRRVARFSREAHSPALHRQMLSALAFLSETENSR